MTEQGVTATEVSAEPVPEESLPEQHGVIARAVLRLRARAKIRTRLREFRQTRRDHRFARRHARWRDEPIVPGAVLYEAFFGNGVLDNPEALFRYLLDQPDLTHLTHLWVVDPADAAPAAMAEFRDHPRVRFVLGRGDDYYRALATSQYLVSNSTFPPQFGKRPGQTYLNTWHGVPLKHMGVDMPDGAIESRNILRNFLQADYVVSANPFMTDVMYRSAYRLQGIFRGAIIEEGQPRTDLQVWAGEHRGSALTRLAGYGIDVGERRVVTWAPTWRGENFNQPVADTDDLIATVTALQEAVGDDTVVLLKAHQVVYDAVRERLGPGGAGDGGAGERSTSLVPNEVPTNLLLGVTDVLVTDYSSIFFDHLGSGRPLVHHVPDLDHYATTRGLYLPPEEWFGPRTATVDELVAAVRAALADPAAHSTGTGGERFAPYDDGEVCRRIADVVFRGRDEAEYRVHRDFDTSKTTLLIYLGGMQSNGIMMSALHLLHNLDYDTYDVTAFWAFSRGRDRSRNARRVDPRVRVLPRFGTFNGDPDEIARQRHLLLNVGLPPDLDEAHVRFWGDEYQRCFGEARFDHVIDFSGYGCLSPFLFSVAPGEPKRSIWLHNDMISDQQRETVGERHLEDRLGAVFTTYRHFDRLVSVSPSLRDLNRTGLAAYAPPEKFTYAVNTMDGERVVAMAEHTPATTPHLVSDLDLPVHERLPAFVGDEVTTFITVGRLSPEKNHARLVEAFALVYAEDPSARLIILGSGKLEHEVAEQIARLGLTDVVLAPGKVDNPFPFLAAADCFVLSSDYEGQPMVILEARVLGLPVVSTEFSSVADSVPEGAGLVVPRSVGGMADGLRAFLAGKVPALRLDHEAYNAEAVEQFGRAINA